MLTKLGEQITRDTEQKLRIAGVLVGLAGGAYVAGRYGVPWAFQQGRNIGRAIQRMITPKPTMPYNQAFTEAQAKAKALLGENAHPLAYTLQRQQYLADMGWA